jgi:uncharacterized protein DUF6883
MRKLRDYCLSARHPRGQHKARVFASVLGIDENGAEFLKDELLNAVLNREVLPGRADIYGQRYILEFEMRGPAGNRNRAQLLDNSHGRILSVINQLLCHVWRKRE